jgi:FtsZ-binding cell division protein ZapB
MDTPVPQTVADLQDEVKALRRQVRELQRERDTWKRKHQSLQAVVRVFLRRLKDGDALNTACFEGLLGESS